MGYTDLSAIRIEIGIMKRRCGFSLIELLIGLSIFSVLIIVMGKLHSAFTPKQAMVKERQLLLPYLDAFEHFLTRENERERCGNWFCYQDTNTKERIFCKERKNQSWFYKIYVKAIKDNLYEADFLGKTRYLCKIYYCL